MNGRAFSKKILAREEKVTTTIASSDFSTEETFISVSLCQELYALFFFFLFFFLSFFSPLPNFVSFMFISPTIFQQKMAVCYGPSLKQFEKDLVEKKYNEAGKAIRKADIIDSR